MGTEEFLKQNVVIKYGETITKKELYNQYKKWCKSKLIWSTTPSRFSMAVYAMFKNQTPKTTSINNGVRVWRNITIANNIS